MHPVAVQKPRIRASGREKTSRPATKTANSGLVRVYYGARYLDPKTSRWISADPAMGEYIPQAPINDEAKKRNGNLPGMGGIYNTVNMHVYHYAGNNPVKLVDPDGRQDVQDTLDEIPIIVRTNELDVYAIRSGTVVFVNDNSQSYGITIVIQDEDGEFVRYAHLDSRAVNLNDPVNEGDVVGVMGSTGTDNTHLHISAYPAGTEAPFWGINATINPETYIQQGTYPANTYISTPFGTIGTIWPSGAHEGTDLSGITPDNLIPNWERGITGSAGIEANNNRNNR